MSTETLHTHGLPSCLDALCHGERCLVLRNAVEVDVLAGQRVCPDSSADRFVWYAEVLSWTGDHRAAARILPRFEYPVPPMDAIQAAHLISIPSSLGTRYPSKVPFRLSRLECSRFCMVESRRSCVQTGRDHSREHHPQPPHLSRHWESLYNFPGPEGLVCSALELGRRALDGQRVHEGQCLADQPAQLRISGCTPVFGNRSRQIYSLIGTSLTHPACL